ncbi:hypothetical protein BUY79_12600 [Staphylococcus equorum]|uniref:hypothetical protein n=1 Tax=Staphylococcus equorum TaxID=246432 RepID=UPI000D1C4E24|nr:hypothetical protein [Staphylococcus equorum]PTE82521.1 hypothetical protein BUY79_12600 [Staphylococcus equorum]
MKTFTFFTTAKNTSYIQDELEDLANLCFKASMGAEFYEGMYVTKVTGDFSSENEFEILELLERIEQYTV